MTLELEIRCQIFEYLEMIFFILKMLLFILQAAVDCMHDTLLVRFVSFLLNVFVFILCQSFVLLKKFTQNQSVFMKHTMQELSSEFLLVIHHSS
jgi:hypothetical protein